ncbi:MAG: hypothetical protein MK135_06825, partial [Polyangiaceae bacterium]|nr:hypothetical protein [Polyangiaceae bacterium]
MSNGSKRCRFLRRFALSLSAVLMVQEPCIAQAEEGDAITSSTETQNQSAAAATIDLEKDPSREGSDFPEGEFSQENDVESRRMRTTLRAPCRRVCQQSESCVDGRCIELCRPGRRTGSHCTPSGTCELNAAERDTVETEGEQMMRRGSASRNSKKALLLDMGGIIGFGASFGMEFGAQKNSFLVRLVPMNTGILSHELLPRTELESFDWGFGV